MQKCHRSWLRLQTSPAVPIRWSIRCPLHRLPSKFGIKFKKGIIMSGKKTAVFGIYKTRTSAEQSVDRLLAAGFSNDDVSVLLPDSSSSKEFAHEKNTKARSE